MTDKYDLYWQGVEAHRKALHAQNKHIKEVVIVSTGVPEWAREPPRPAPVPAEPPTPFVGVVMLVFDLADLLGSDDKESES